MDPLIGRTIGGVRLESKLGAGGMAAVYAGRDEERGGARRAIKLLSVAAHDHYKNRFEREAQIGTELKDPRLVGVHRHGVSGDYHFMVMDLVEGEDLSRVMQRTNRLPWPVVAALGRDVAAALAALHEKGVVHRDLKPANVLLDGRGGLKLADFGLARWRQAPSHLPTEAPLTETGDAFGTPVYMAPEQFDDAKTVRPPADLYALGVMLFEGLTGLPPFQSDTAIDLARLHRDVEAPPLEAQAADAPEELRLLVQQLLDKDPARRPTSDEVARRCETLAARAPSEPIALEPPPGSEFLDWDPNRTPALEEVSNKTTVPPRAGRARTPAILLGLSLALVVGGLLFAARLPWVRLQLASAEERSRWEAINAAMADVGKSHEPLVEAIDSYLRDFGETGKLRGDVREIRSRPIHKRANLYFFVADQADMVHVPGGRYEVGLAPSVRRLKKPTEELPAPRVVDLQAFLIDRHEVSRRRYERFLAEWRAVGAKHRCGRADVDHALPPASFKLSPDPDGPAVGVSPWDAVEYARFYGRRLPSEAEWEVAASWDPQSAKARPYPWGDREPSDDEAYFANLSYAEHGQVDEDSGDFHVTCASPGTFELDRSAFGLLDIAGNASEWCAGELPLPGRQPIRGGSLFTQSPRQALLAYRRLAEPKEPPQAVGFRTAMPFEEAE